MFSLLLWLSRQATNFEDLRKRASLGKYLSPSQVPGAFNDEELSKRMKEFEAHQTEFERILQSKPKRLDCAEMKLKLAQMENRKHNLSCELQSLQAKLREAGFDDASSNGLFGKVCKLRAEQESHTRLEQEEQSLVADKELLRLRLASRKAHLDCISKRVQDGASGFEMLEAERREKLLNHPLLIQ